ncbi:hypothetical protein [Haloferax massiliensis]|uniref:Uncharacterized protein n=1 Tax=Haloferax massiliensis TaxID=1476858 RepID=A0A0D6JLK1_9EURY|nr:hypothetical protein [Haloferax massiliensis]CQR48759.1 hypothetical protein BN996_00207 [Haloferax massiliensis]
MSYTRFRTAVETTCKRYGPDRLPKADRRDIGAGYAMATTAAGATLVFVLLAWGLFALGAPSGSDWALMALFGMGGLPLVVPAAFVSAVTVWRTLPADVPHFGAVAGMLTTLGTYFLGLCVVFAFLVVPVGVSGQVEVAQLLEAAGFAAAIGFVAVASTIWVAVPIGVGGGLIHEAVARGHLAR